MGVALRFEASEIRDALNKMRGGLLVPNHFRYDGCTCAPDSIDGCDFKPACCVHDWRYSQGFSEKDRFRADKELRANLRQLLWEHLKAGTWKDAIRRAYLVTIVPGVYYRRVRVFGMSGFRHSDKATPKHCLLLKTRYLVTRYFT
jgi:hypothetical protein